MDIYIDVSGCDDIWISSGVNNHFLIGEGRKSQASWVVGFFAPIERQF
jgi:hypothetical protein